MYNGGGDVYASLYNSEYNIANLKEIADRIRNEKKAILIAFNIKNLVDGNTCSQLE